MLKDLLTNSAGSGYLDSKVKYNVHVKKSSSAATKGGNKNKMSPVYDEEYTEAMAKQDVQELKHILVDEANMESIKKKLKSTVNYRTKIMNDENMDLLQYFPYFFARPDLVCYCYHKT